MNKVDIRHIIKDIAEGYVFKFKDDKLDLNADLRGQYHIDEIEISLMFEEFEEEVDIKLDIADIYFDTDDFEKIKTLNDIITIIHEKISK